MFVAIMVSEVKCTQLLFDAMVLLSLLAIHMPITSVKVHSKRRRMLIELHHCFRIINNQGVLLWLYVICYLPFRSMRTEHGSIYVAESS